MTDKKHELHLLRADVESAQEFYQTAVSKLRITRDALDKFERLNPDLIAQERREAAKIREEEYQKTKDKKAKVGKVVFENVRPNMWVKVKTSRGSEYRYVTAVTGKETKDWNRISIQAARIITKELMFRGDDRKIKFRDIIVTPSIIERQDNYVATSIISILVQDETDPSLLKEVSIRKDLLK